MLTVCYAWRLSYPATHAYTPSPTASPTRDIAHGTQARGEAVARTHTARLAPRLSRSGGRSSGRRGQRRHVAHSRQHGAGAGGGGGRAASQRQATHCVGRRGGG